LAFEVNLTVVGHVDLAHVRRAAVQVDRHFGRAVTIVHAGTAHAVAGFRIRQRQVAVHAVAVRAEGHERIAVTAEAAHEVAFAEAHEAFRRNGDRDEDRREYHAASGPPVGGTTPTTTVTPTRAE